MGEALTEVVTAAEPLSNNAAKEHLDPADNGHDLADDAMCSHDVSADAAVDALGEMKFEVDANDGLDEKHEHERGCERGVNVMCKLAAAVHVPKEISQDGHDSSKTLKRNMPSRSDNLLFNQLMFAKTFH